MPTILLEEIIAILKGWISDFTTYAAGVLDKLGIIKTNTDKLPDIKDNTDDIKSNTAAIITPITTIEGNVTSIKNNTDSIKTDATIIKNNAQSISTSAGAAAAFSEDIANNTLDIDNRVVTIGSDTTQLRTNSNAMASDLHDIKQALQYYFLTNIVTEDSEGSIANFDTDLQDYLQKAVVTIPSDANGISDCHVGYVDFNQLVLNGNFINTSNWTTYESTITCNNNEATIEGTLSYFGIIQYVNFIQGHKYLFNCDAKASTLNNPIIPCYSNNSYVPTETIMPIDTQYHNYSYVRECMQSGTSVAVGARVGNYNDIQTLYIKNYFIIDLTEALGSAIADQLYSLSDHGLHIIKSIFKNDYYAYNAGGSLVSVQSVNGSYYPNASVSFLSPITDGGELDLLTGLLKVNSTPISYQQLDPVAIRTLKGLNSIWSDIGDMSVTYRETLKHYLDKQNS